MYVCVLLCGCKGSSVTYVSDQDYGRTIGFTDDQEMALLPCVGWWCRCLVIFLVLVFPSFSLCFFIYLFVCFQIIVLLFYPYNFCSCCFLLIIFYLHLYHQFFLDDYCCFSFLCITLLDGLLKKKKNLTIILVSAEKVSCSILQNLKYQSSVAHEFSFALYNTNCHLNCLQLRSWRRE